MKVKGSLSRCFLMDLVRSVWSMYWMRSTRVTLQKPFARHRFGPSFQRQCPNVAELPAPSPDSDLCWNPHAFRFGQETTEYQQSWIFEWACIPRREPSMPPRMLTQHKQHHIWIHLGIIACKFDAYLRKLRAAIMFAASLETHQHLTGKARLMGKWRWRHCLSNKAAICSARETSLSLHNGRPEWTSVSYVSHGSFEQTLLQHAMAHQVVWGDTDCSGELGPLASISWIVIFGQKFLATLCQEAWSHCV